MLRWDICLKSVRRVNAFPIPRSCTVCCWLHSVPDSVYLTISRTLNIYVQVHNCPFATLNAIWGLRSGIIALELCIRRMFIIFCVAQATISEYVKSLNLTESLDRINNSLQEKHLRFILTLLFWHLKWHRKQTDVDLDMKLMSISTGNSRKSGCKIQVKI